MKLINKKTGEVVNGSIILKTDYHSHPWNCDSIAEIVEHWEDYKEPLIKDEKIRKVVRAWAEANNFFDEKIEAHSLTAGTRFSIENYDIEFLGYFIYDLEANKTYTIAELCGEEEE